MIHALGTGNQENEGFKVIFDSLGVLGQPGLWRLCPKELIKKIMNSKIFVISFSV